MNKLFNHILITTSLCLSAYAEIDFNRDIRPIFNRSCTGCHGGVKKAGGLSLITKEEAYGKTEHGIGIVPGKAEESMLYKLITHEDPSRRMPFEKTPLTAEEITLIRDWINDGAQWDEHWSYMPIKNFTPPANSAKTDIDKFLKRKLDEKKLLINTEADKNTLIRRTFLDLIGMPPTEEEFLRFQQSSHKEMVDYLLASPKYGEKWTSMWLDLARYADTMGYEKDPHRNIHDYKSWLIKAFNKDLPYDQFITEQLAGDMLANPSNDQLIATAYHRNTQTNTEGGTSDEEFRTAAVMDRTVNTWEALMGTSFGCVQCHSHPYDPIDHNEYFEFMSFFNNTADNDQQNDFPTLLLQSQEQKELVAKLQPELNAMRQKEKELDNKIKSLEVEKATEKNDAATAAQKEKVDNQKDLLTQLKKELAELKKKSKQVQNRINHAKRNKVPIMKELDKPRETHVFIRGNWEDHGEKVSPGVPKIMNEFPKGAPKNRLGLSQWLTAPENPLVSRVAVNRIWEQLFGYGIVETLEDFGSQGKKPSHPELLDHLAYNFMDQHKWSIKSLIKEIVSTEAYKRSSHVNPQDLEKDPRNMYLARFPRVRLTPEQIRDQALRASGLLSEKMYGPSVMPYQPDGVWQTVYSGHKWQTPQNEDRYRRALYTYWKRTSPYPAMETFDMTPRENCTTRRIRTNTPLQALVTLNDPAFMEMATELGKKMGAQQGDFSAKINKGFHLLLVRQATKQEIEILQEIFTETKKSGKKDHECWAVIGNIMLNLDETVNKI
ncbi:probable chromosome segregation protein [Lentisphaera araneosa HTCC2155]|uniref:Probable chromosome segregation protein n=1 Tax=Lentisphaera araneosa HTCC2155 TaxID=313628 RepID=A6DPT9_9BACT|nr:PSD1 and planctomycete cytochrome C domain-containing protein [Lentisphaera araneosa]EDM26384.1 probable chromosome segregation protein [Lentisphaera araneosa HTCC2155]